MTLRIVAIADTHLYHGDIDVPDGDWLVHAGDLTRSGTIRELNHAAGWLRRMPHRRKLVVAGNHERCLQAEPDAARAVLEGLTYLEDEAVVVDGVRVYGSPWQPWFHDWAFNLHRGPALREVWQKIPDDTEILITHSPPAGIGDRVGGLNVGCVDLEQRVRVVRPRLHIFGHIHTDRGTWHHGDTTFVNATTDEGQAPATVIDYPIPIP